MRCIMIFFVAISFFLPAVQADSHQKEIWSGNVNIQIVSDRGDDFHVIPHKEFRKRGTHIIKRYLDASKGENYSIVIRNNMTDRIGVVIAVDGRNIISGKKSNLRNNESMYIVDAYGHAKYEGWRTDKNTVHRFYFTDIKDSYAMRTFSDSSAMGVIAVAVFREKDRPRVMYKEKSRMKSAPAVPSLESGAREDRSEMAGTGFGDSTYSPTIKVKFRPERTPFKKILVKYEWHDVLCRKGILKCWPEVGNRLWDEDEFAPFPPGYYGD